MKKSGYTIIELMIVIAIIAIISAAALGGMTNIIKSLRFTNTFNKIIFMVQQARSLAMSGKNPASVNDYGVQFDLNAPSSVTLFADKNNNMTYDSTSADDMIEQMTLATVPNLIIVGASTGATLACTSSMAILFQNNNGSVSLKCDGADEIHYLQIGLRDTSRNIEKSFLIHKIAGVPQVQ